MAVDIRRLTYFNEIVASGSLAAAARKLRVAQPALSLHVKELEKVFGLPLLTRTNRGVAATAAGERLAQRATELLQDFDDLIHDVKHLARVPHGRVAVALSVTMNRHIVPELISLVSGELPEVVLDVHAADSAYAIDLFEAEVVDIALLPNAPNLSRVVARPIYQEPIFLIEQRRGELNDRSPIPFRYIGDRPLVLPSIKRDLRIRLEEAAHSSHLMLNVRYEQHAIDTIRGLVLDGIASTLTQASVFHPLYEQPHLDIRRIIEPAIIRTHSVVIRHDRIRSPAVQAVSDAIARALEALVANGTLCGTLLPPPQSEPPGPPDPEPTL